MWEFELEAQVVCVNDEFRFNAGEKTPVLGGIYTIREMMSEDGDLCIRLYEIINPEMYYGGDVTECWFLSHHFRPVKKTDISDLEAILKKIPTPEEIEHFTDDLYELEPV